MSTFARTRRLLLLLLSAVLLGAPLSAHAAPPNTASITEVPDFGANPGNLQMFQYVPEGLAEGRPVVVLHGCTQNATDYGNDTVGGYPREIYEDSDGNAVVEAVTVTGMGHGQPVDPGTGEGQCGNAAAHALDVDVCAAWHLGQTWNLS
ncbi:hypothetical protein [Saccharomonospora sp.]|uniref:hypothetical protein n=1 Tax=Saccharomonospora sp. TaxID=33913 RepID=UPI0026099EBB|nr:hypothetical protein [Saccharomonospora sp.]